MLKKFPKQWRRLTADVDSYVVGLLTNKPNHRLVSNKATARQQS